MARTIVPLGRPGAVTRVEEVRDQRHALPAPRDVGKNQPAEAAKGGNYGMSRFNAVRHSVLSQFTVLPWESETEYRALLDALVAEHRPIWATETYLVEELAGVLWRKRRLRLAEAAMYHVSEWRIATLAFASIPSMVWAGSRIAE